MSQIELATIEKKIEQTKTEITNCTLIDNEALRNASISELEIRLTDLMKQKKSIEAAAWKETVKLRITGEKVDSGRISSRTLVMVLDGFTQLTDSIANAVLNTPSEKGRIPQFVQESVDFQVASTFAGSFGIVLEKLEDTCSLLPTPTKVDAVLNEVFAVLEANGNAEHLLDAIIPSGRRAITNYKTWLVGLEESGVDVEVDWRNRSAERRVVSIYSKNSTDTITVLEGIEDIENSEIDITGVLTGINIRNNRFEITVEGLGVIKGNGKLETLISVSELMGEEIQASLIRSTTQSKAKIEKISWYLVSANVKQSGTI